MEEASELMQKFGITWTNINDKAEHCIDLINTQSQTAIDLAETTLKMIAAVTNKDLSALLPLFQEEVVDVEKIKEAITKEFNL